MMLRLSAGLAAICYLAGVPAGASEAPPPLPERKAAAVAAPPPDIWSPAEIATAQAQCAAALQKIDAVIEPQPPIKEGECGTAAPVKLLSIGKNPTVTFSPAALVNCGMLEPLHRWVTKELQPLASRQLGSRIVKIEVMSDYSCRRALGRKGKKLSEHAYVDALDIRGFETAKKQKVTVLGGWGPNRRDIAAMVAAARVAAVKKETEAKASTRAGNAAEMASHVRKKQTLAVDAARLGGPDESPRLKPLTQKNAVGPLPPPGTDGAPDLTPLLAKTNVPDARFLRAAHAAACRIFGTTLGPEANEMHRNHFHVDMAVRKIKPICD